MAILPQIVVALLAGGFYYMLAVFVTVYDGVLSLIFQPIMAAIVTGAALLVLLIAGLPIRLIGTLNAWWRNHWWIPLALGSVALLMMLASWMPPLRVKIYDPELEVLADSFHPVLAVSGWLLTIFSALHFYPPLRGYENGEEKKGPDDTMKRSPIAPHDQRRRGLRRVTGLPY